METFVVWGAFGVLIVSNLFSLWENHKLKGLVKARDEYIKEVSATVAALWNGYDG